MNTQTPLPPPPKKRNLFRSKYLYLVLIIIIGVASYFYATAKPWRYCEDEGRVIPVEELCERWLKEPFEKGHILLGEGDKTLREYINNNKKVCYISDKPTLLDSNSNNVGASSLDVFEGSYRYYLTLTGSSYNSNKHSSDIRSKYLWNIFTSNTCGDIRHESKMIE